MLARRARARASARSTCSFRWPAPRATSRVRVSATHARRVRVRAERGRGPRQGTRDRAPRRAAGTAHALRTSRSARRARRLPCAQTCSARSAARETRARGWHRCYCRHHYHRHILRCHKPRRRSPLRSSCRHRTPRCPLRRLCRRTRLVRTRLRTGGPCSCTSGETQRPPRHAAQRRPAPLPGQPREQPCQGWSKAHVQGSEKPIFRKDCRFSRSKGS